MFDMKVSFPSSPLFIDNYFCYCVNNNSLGLH